MGLSVVARRRVQMIYRSKRIAQQFEMVHRGLVLNMARAEILDRLNAARYSVNDLMAQLIEEEILTRPRDAAAGKSREQIVEGLMELLRTYIG